MAQEEVTFGFDCPECGKELSVGEDRLGQKVRCPSCKAQFELPAADEVEIEGAEGTAGREPEPRNAPDGAAAAGLDARDAAAPPKRKPGSATQAPGDKATKRRVRTDEETGGRASPRAEGPERRRRPEDDDGTTAGVSPREAPDRATGRPGDKAKGLWEPSPDGEPRARVDERDKKKGTRTIPKKPAKGKSNRNLLIAAGAVGGLVLVAVAAILFALPKGNSGDGGKDGGKGTGKGPASSKGEDPKKAERERRIEDFRGRAGLARTAEDHLALAQEAESLGLKPEAESHFRKALELDPENETALAKLRYERYELPESASAIPAELLPGISDQVGKWFSPSDLKKLREKEKDVLAAAKAELDKRARDPFYARMAEILQSIENVQGFKDYLFHTQRSDPYLLVEHVGKKGFNPYRSDEAKKLAEQKVEGLKKVYAFVVENFMKPAGLTRDETRPLGVVSFEDRAVFDEFQKAIGMDLPPGAAAYFSPVTKFVVMNNAPGAQYGPEEQTQSILIHEATHQIVDAFCNPTGGMDVRCSLWANEGLAEYVASMRLKPKPDGSFEYLLAYEMSSGRLGEFYSARFPKKFKEMTAFGLEDAYALSLEEMVQMHNQPQCMGRVLQKWVQAGGRNPGEADLGTRNHILTVIGCLIYAEATSFYFFCLQGKPEAYKDKLMEYLKREFAGRSTTRNAQTFKEIFGKDLAALEKEWLDYVDSKTTAGIKDGHMR